MPEPISATLTRGAITMLSQVLSLPEWTKDVADKYRAGQLIEERLILDVPRPAYDDPQLSDADAKAAFEAWANAEVTITWTERQRDVVKKCLTETLNRLPCGRHTNRLIQAVGLQPD
jgi:hypothetical protein